jgi:hypothetical protein
VQVAGALDRKERLLSQLRSMNDEAEKAGPDARKTQPSDTFRQAYADVVMQLKQVLACQTQCCLHALTSVCVLFAMYVWRCHSSKRTFALAFVNFVQHLCI